MPVIDKLTGATGLSGLHLLLGAVGVSLILYITATTIYNIFFHPLASYPGPLLHRASPIPFGIRHTLGLQAFHTQTLHDKYGPVVRISPNHLSFTDVRAWRDIYGHIAGSRQGQEEMSKCKSFVRPVDDQATHIISAGREEHTQLRRALSNSFSDASMRGQGPLIGKYIDLLIHKLHEQGEEGRVPLNATSWYNCVTFDITGDLIFGMPFGALAGNANHPWLQFILGSLKSMSPLGALSYVGLHWVAQVLWKMLGAEVFRKSMESVDLMLKERLKMPVDRNDLFVGLVQRQEKLGLSFEKLSANAWFLVLAGSETTATTLSGVTYFLTQNPEVLKRVTQEVRTAFKSVEEIDINSVNKLTYMLAVLNETLRLYPPVTSNLPRIVPRGGAKVLGEYIPEGTLVEVQQWSMNHSQENWADPWTFNPARFLDDKETAMAKGNMLDALQAFGVGPRNCLGRNLAYAEMRWILARILFDFDLRGAPTNQKWIERQRSYGLWMRVPLDVYFEPAREKK
ncbi:cytochrome P450 [Neurospora tetraspora]|uniref:Cytochrome P450 n=1 Tax=Neurospora tetraspora TaxID=94610 RepID=A0AAE0JR18_9PEZI|nr:cytochrome P450 [Neurospora tetraspora]